MDYKKKIEEFILTECLEDSSVQHIGDDENLLESGILESLGILKLIAFFDEEFNIEFPTNELKLSNFTNLNTIAALVEKLHKVE